MNIVNSTANKVLELEKRLDNQLVDKSVKVSEVSKIVEAVLDSAIEYPILTFASKNDISVVVQGDLDIVTADDSLLFITLVLDGFEVYSKKVSLSAGQHSISVMKAINVLAGSNERLVLKIDYSALGEVYFKGYNFFVWGYGESLDLGVQASEPKISATEKNDRVAVAFSLDGSSFMSYLYEFPESLNFSNFSYLGEFLYVEPIYDENADGSPKLLLFAISKNNNLVLLEGEVFGVNEEDGVMIDSDVVSVSATRVNNSDEILVVYAKKSGEVNYFSIIDGVRSSVMTLTKMDEAVGEVSLIQNCETTTFLVVGLESGRNYLYSSVTSVAWADKLSHINMSMEVSFP